MSLKYEFIVALGVRGGDGHSAEYFAEIRRFRQRSRGARERTRPEASAMLVTEANFAPDEPAPNPRRKARVPVAPKEALS